MGALGIGGFPLWSGYISKTLLHESIVEYMHGLEAGHFAGGMFLVEDVKIFEWIFLISGGLTIAYMCKLFVAVFVEKNSDDNVQRKYDAMTSYMKPASTFALVTSAVLIPVLGMLPKFTMDRLADMSQGFMGLTHAGHDVHYFAWVNLKGSVISIVIGVFVYGLIVRTWMMKKQEDGCKAYVNRWSKYFDLEDTIYRPILLNVIPTICGAVCLVLDHITDVLVKVLPIAGNVQAGFFDNITDGLIVFLRKTVYKDSPQIGELEEGNEMTHAVGTFLNKVERFLNYTIWRNHPHKKDFEHDLVLRLSSFKENAGMIGRSLSYGLLLFSLGLCATLIYLLLSMI
jgi:hydrogenase-4 component B